MQDSVRLVNFAPVNRRGWIIITCSLVAVTMVFQFCARGSGSNGEEAEEGGTDSGVSPVAEITSLLPEIDPVKPAEEGYFGNPLHDELKASGTFGELRPNHFHAGIDLRTLSVEGLPVLAVADGYVTRLKISPFGYGNVLYVSHDNGYMSVYGHLKKFNGDIRTYTEDQQYKSRKYEIELFPGMQLKVRKGDTIAWSGNTGGSAAPHLHFEIRKIASGETVNPLLVGFQVADTMKPRIRSLRLYQRDDTVLSQTGTHRYAALPRSYRQMRVPPGEYGLGIHWVDFHVDFMNKLGINFAEMYVNGELTYKHDIRSYDFNETKLINLHIDYPTYNSSHRHYVRFYKVNGNKLRFYATRNDGWIPMEAGDTADVKILIRDNMGMADSVKFQLICVENGRRFYRLPKVMAKADGGPVTSGGGNLETPGCRAVFNPNTVFFDTDLQLWKARDLSGRPSGYYYVHKDVIPLRKDFRVQIKVDSAYHRYGDKLVVMSESSRGLRCLEGEYKDGWIGAWSRKLGGFYVDVDTVKPVVRVYQSGRNLRVALYDKLSGIGDFTVSIDGKWILMDYEPKSSSLSGRIPAWIEKGEHKLVVRVVDKRNNVNLVERTIRI